ncbi:MAG: hypothetical protein CYPHOPRED_005868 [Cyphobasidiales sp. Tagirdzhanova-0007]|nr:MAG: hypothetical protein CYPHOPRED_005868 [Cyphobasidiales sp. Tagirdzhanova-0007]
MRTSFIVLGAASLSLSGSLSSVVAAPLLSSLLGSVLPGSSNGHSYTSKHVSNTSPHYSRSPFDNGILVAGMGSDTVLQSIHILPDDDNDGLLDLEGKLKVLKNGELLDLGGVVRVGNVLDACVEVVVDGKSTQHCGRSSEQRMQRKYRTGSKHRDNWSKEEHRRCSAHFRQWHRHHSNASESCGNRLEEALKKIQELESKLERCSGQSDYTPKRIKSVSLASRPPSNSKHQDNDANVEQDNNEKTVSSSNDETETPSSSARVGDHERYTATHTTQYYGSWSTGHSESGSHIEECKGTIQDKIDQNGIHVKVCIAASVDVARVKASAEVKAHADVNLNKGEVDAAASATVTANVLGVASVSAQASATASVNLQKGTADVKVDSNEALGLGHAKIINTGINAEVALHQDCGAGAILNAMYGVSSSSAGVCVALSSDNSKDSPLENSGSLLGLGNALGDSRVR